MTDRQRRRRVAAAISGLRDLRIELAVLNHRIGNRVELKDLDFDCLDVVARHGPISPSALAGRVGVHLATMTGILNRLEAGGWVTRERAEKDRRAVVVASTPDRQRELYGLFGKMNTRMGQICDRYTDEELDVIVDFLSRTVAAGRVSSDEVG
ncbi:MAG: MarR family winged helix-turn-helix transcriptional regulator [Jiangellaceae bacterium]